MPEMPDSSPDAAALENNTKSDSDLKQYMATCPKSMEHLLAQELRQLGASDVQESVAAVYFSAELAVAYHICHWSRIANRIIHLLLRTRVDSDQAMYEQVNGLDWSACFSSQKRLSVDFNGTSAFIRDARYGQQRVKDAVNDYFLARGQQRLTVDAENPDVVIYVRLYSGRLSLGLDLVGESLHRRGYRERGGAAPLKENLAAALLLQAGWPAIAAGGGALVDPMCGSGTVLIEAALIQLDIAPSFLRESWKVQNYNDFDTALWQAEVENVRNKRETALAESAGAEVPVLMSGSDLSASALDLAASNIERAGLDRYIQLRQCEVAQLKPDQTQHVGLVLVNPPYGERLGDFDELDALYAQLGKTLREHFLGWEAAIFTGNHQLGWATGLRSWRQHRLYNGAIECQLQRYRVLPENFSRSRNDFEQRVFQLSELNENATMLANRLKKNRRRLKSWLAKHQWRCFRLYNADLPEYAVAIDCYAAWDSEVDSSAAEKNRRDVYGQRASSVQSLQVVAAAGKDPKWYFHVQEYAAPASVDAGLAKKRLKDVVAALSAVFECPTAGVVVKRREKQRGDAQYQKLSSESPDYVVRENGHHFIVNFGRYLDTGLFLDSRPVREKIASAIEGKRFLNLFSYTSTATVYAIKAGAKSSCSVDLSKTYLSWSRDNFVLNGLDSGATRDSHQLVQADCLEWLEQQAERQPGSFDCILLDPPSFSNSSRMNSTLDIGRDHEQLIEQCMSLLDRMGELYFVTNKRGFRIAASLSERYQIESISSQTLDEDFRRGKPAHQSWRIQHQR